MFHHSRLKHYMVVSCWLQNRMALKSNSTEQISLEKLMREKKRKKNAVRSFHYCPENILLLDTEQNHLTQSQKLVAAFVSKKFQNLN
jgi:Pyruvate/2-oxoacid:ferredoxin oxidoreductase delta subunit